MLNEKLTQSWFWN